MDYDGRFYKIAKVWYTLLNHCVPCILTQSDGGYLLEGSGWTVECSDTSVGGDCGYLDVIVHKIGEFKGWLTDGEVIDYLLKNADIPWEV